MSNTQDTSKAGKAKVQEAASSLTKLFPSLKDKNAGSRHLLLQGCVINNPEDCFEADVCQQCPDNKNHG